MNSQPPAQIARAQRRRGAGKASGLTGILPAGARALINTDESHAKAHSDAFDKLHTDLVRLHNSRNEN